MAVLSDCHASSAEGEPSSESTWVHVADNDPKRNPLAGLAEFIASREELRAEVLLCPGDLCDRADWDALPGVWEQLSGLAESLGASAVLATAGNHDIDQRKKHAPEPLQAGLMGLRPHFPDRSEEEVRNYWEDRLHFAEGPDWQVVTLNSSLMRYLEKDEKDHGMIDDQTLERLEARLKGREFPVNVLLCHHHPQPSTHLDPSDRSHMENGDRLVRLLDDIDGHWLVIHGHKHEPSLEQLSGSGEAPFRLAAGSVGANLRGTLGAHVRNQLHLVEFPIDECQDANLTLAGYVRSYTWQPRTGWRGAAEADGLPANAGFGHSQSGSAVADEMLAWATESSLSVIERPALLARFPKFRFMLPADVTRFIDKLEQEGCNVHYDRGGNVSRVVLP